jgi:2,3-bisphosphoglycerate-dependent phosphoglycerate mutase
MHRRVFLIRHCQSEANRDLKIETRGDSPLTDLGLEQARQRARTLAEHELAEVTVVASPQQRAAMTAREIADHHGWTLAHDPRLVEGDLGKLEGLAYHELIPLLPKGKAWLDAEDHGGEAEDLVADRMLEALAEALDAAPGPVVIVSHGYAISALLGRLGHKVRQPANGDMYELDLDESATAHRLEHHPLNAQATAEQH